MKPHSNENDYEFSRPFTVDRLHDKPFHEPIEANEDERAALAKRLNIVGIKSFEADLTLLRAGDVVGVTGKLKATVVQNCVVTLEDFTSKVEEEIQSYYIEAAKASRHTPKTEEEISLEDEHSPEPIPANGAIDLGEIAAQYLSLSLDPYPRKPGAEFKPPSGDGDEKRNPFAVLAEFRNKKK
jgi:uncharacterized metal-binding protein YceD (DUF177 family)